jgi:hypothetical protein
MIETINSCNIFFWHVKDSIISEDRLEKEITVEERINLREILNIFLKTKKAA